MRISIVGTGYVGLVSGVCLASVGHDVICIDKREDIVNKINSSVSPIYEPKLEEMLNVVIKEKKLSASADISWAMKNSEITIIAVGTPYKDGAIDLSYIKECAREIGVELAAKNEYHVICVKSTVVPGTTDTVVRAVIEEASNKKAGSFGLAMNPEFLREGCAVDDFILPDRIVIGAYDERSFEAMASLYEIFDAPIIKTNLRTAEMIKYTSNAFLANLISFANDISNICESIGGIDAMDVFSGLILDKRIAVSVEGKTIYPGLTQYLKPGCGFGGSCFPKDVKALMSHSINHFYYPKTLDAILSINELQPKKMIEKLEGLIGEIRGKKIAVLGVAFKPDTDDIREASAIKIIKILLEKGAKVFACDPKALANTAKEIENEMLFLSEDYRDALSDAEGALLVTSWQSFMDIKPSEFIQLMKTPAVVDGRRVYDRKVMLEAGLQYTGIGIKYQ